MIDVLCMFAKSPRLGTVKTRLAAAIGDDAALALYRRLGCDMMTQLRLVPGARVRVFFTPIEDEKLVHEWLGPDIEYVPQKGDDLGARMANALSDGFGDGSRHVVLVGCDAPSLGAQHIKRVLKELRCWDMVFIPADDGGYIVAGFSRAVPGFLEAMTYGHENVMAETMRRAADWGLSAFMMEKQSDLDTENDLGKFPELESWIRSRS